MQLNAHSFEIETSIPSGLSPMVGWLIANNKISYAQAEAATQTAQALGADLSDILAKEYGLNAEVIAGAIAAEVGAKTINPAIAPPDPLLVAEFNPLTAIRLRLLPWRRVCGETIILAANPKQFRDNKAVLTATFGRVRLAITTGDQLNTAIEACFGSHLARNAELRLPDVQSSRSWNSAQIVRKVLKLCFVFVCLALLSIEMTIGLMVAITFLSLSLITLQTMAAIIASRSYRPPKMSVTASEKLPTITLLVPLFKETKIAGHLIERLQALEYPKSLLDVCLVLEASDTTTLSTLESVNLPPWIRTIQVPDGEVKTKPKALNYALNTASGSIIGVYDAEDAPARSQLMIVAKTFERAPSHVGCLQGTLDFYNSDANWLTKCFTIEYAAWFRVVLPGLSKLGFPVPLGGTTIFFRRDALDKLGAWDAHNVTEDADLGIRLARKGFKTEFIPTVTEEEANGRLWPWVKQRSRWLKGYAMTYAVHMRQPVQLLRELGPWQFCGFQILFLGTLLQFFFAPILWTLWIAPFIGSATLTNAIGPQLWIALISISVTCTLVNLYVSWLGLKRAKKVNIAPWALTMFAYFPLATWAIYKGLWELITRPFYWDKTEHGVLMPSAKPA